MDATILQGEGDFQLSYAADVPCVVMVWRGYHDSTSFRARNEEVLDFIKERRATRLLGDIRTFVLIGQSDQEWLNANWLPRAMAAGLRICALVTPTFYFNRVAVQTVADRVDSAALKIEYFESAEAACDWLKRPVSP
jgi:hypothetical protein